jgi:hypothetical protein
VVAFRSLNRRHLDREATDFAAEVMASTG